MEKNKAFGISMIHKSRFFMIYQNHEENNIMIVIESKDELFALKSLHEKFIIK